MGCDVPGRVGADGDNRAEEHKGACRLTGFGRDRQRKAQRRRRMAIDLCLETAADLIGVQLQQLGVGSNKTERANWRRQGLKLPGFDLADT